MHTETAVLLSSMYLNACLPNCFTICGSQYSPQPMGFINIGRAKAKGFPMVSLLLYYCCSAV